MGEMMLLRVKAGKRGKAINGNMPALRLLGVGSRDDATSPCMRALHGGLPSSVSTTPALLCVDHACAPQRTDGCSMQRRRARSLWQAKRIALVLRAATRWTRTRTRCTGPLYMAFSFVGARFSPSRVVRRHRQKRAQQMHTVVSTKQPARAATGACGAAFLCVQNS